MKKFKISIAALSFLFALSAAFAFKPVANEEQGWFPYDPNNGTYATMEDPLAQSHCNTDIEEICAGKFDKNPQTGERIGSTLYETRDGLYVTQP
jgi:hypothetical protein